MGMLDAEAEEESAHRTQESCMLHVEAESVNVVVMDGEDEPDKKGAEKVEPEQVPLKPSQLTVKDMSKRVLEGITAIGLRDSTACVKNA